MDKKAEPLKVTTQTGRVRISQTSAERGEQVIEVTAYQIDALVVALQRAKAEMPGPSTE